MLLEPDLETAGIPGEAVAEHLEDRLLARPDPKERREAPVRGELEEPCELPGGEDLLGEALQGSLQAEALHVDPDDATADADEDQVRGVGEVELDPGVRIECGLAVLAGPEREFGGRSAEVGSEDPAQESSSRPEAPGVDLAVESRRSCLLVGGQAPGESGGIPRSLGHDTPPPQMELLCPEFRGFAPALDSHAGYPKGSAPAKPGAPGPFPGESRS